MKRFSCIFTIFLTVCFAQNTFAQKTFKLGYVKKIDYSTESVWLARTKKKDRVDEKAVARLTSGFTGKININGRDIDLKSVKEHLPEKNYKVGRGGYEIWKGKNVIVRIDYIFTWLCPPADEQCETYYYKGVLDIYYKKMRRKVNVVGFGGS